MKALCACLLVVLLTSCMGNTPQPPVRTNNYGWPMRQMDAAPDTAKYPMRNDDQKAFETYVIDVNVYAYYVYTYARNLNEYAKAKGWHPPKVAPICEEFDVPDLHPIPERLTLDRNSRTPEQISRDLADQFRAILANYRADRKAFRANYADHRKSCLD